MEKKVGLHLNLTFDGTLKPPGVVCNPADWEKGIDVGEK
jgi:hypothetical protein